LKFGRKTKLADHLAKLMTATLLKEFDIGEIDTIVPVPLHKRRLRWRGFNQSLLLAKGISSATGIEVDYFTLKRIRHTKPQTRLPLSQRSENVKGAFQVIRPNFVKDRAILLVDDVFTSGATLMECARTLKANGARAVYALCAVRAILDEPETAEI
jgi:ComF family protein